MAAAEYKQEEGKVELYHYVYLVFLAIVCTWASNLVANRLPSLDVPVLFFSLIISTGTWRILIISALGLALSFTRARHIPGSFQLAMAFIYIFVARMGASADFGTVRARI